MVFSFGGVVIDSKLEETPTGVNIVLDSYLAKSRAFVQAHPSYFGKIAAYTFVLV